MTVDFSFQVFGTVGPLNGTLSRTQVRSILGGDFEEFKKTAASLNTTDAFLRYDLNVFYDHRDVVKGAEFFERSGVTWMGHKLVGQKLSRILSLFRSNGIQPVIDDDGFDVSEFGMSFYVPDIEDGEDALIKSLYINLRTDR